MKWVDIGSGGTTNQTVKIRAKGSNPNQWPIMRLFVNGVQKQEWTVNTSSWTEYTASVPLTGQDQIDVVFPNDNNTGGVDANLFVDWIQVNGVTYQETQGIVDRGAGNSAFDGNDILVGGNLYWNGALRFVVGSGGTAMGYDANGNMSYKLQPGEALLYEWNHENRLATVKRNGLTTDQYLYDPAGQRVKKTSIANGTTFYVNGRYELSNEEVWIDDAIPGGATVTNGEDGWNWDTTEKISGRTAHRSALQSGTHQHYFSNAQETMSVKSGDTLYAYIYLDPNNPPQEVMLQWNDGDWNQRAYWGQNLINWGTDGTNSRRYMGSLPATGGWVRLEVPAAQVGLEGKTVNGMAFVLYGGRAWWDRAGVRRAVHAVTKYYDFNGQRVAMRRDGLLTYLHTDHLGSVVQRTNSSGTILGNHAYQGYGSRRGGDELATDHRFTGQKLDGTGLQYFNARYYDPVIGQFISPDSIVPDATNLFDYNRYMYVRGRVLNMTDPTGHCSTSQPSTSDAEAYREWSSCWTNVNTILQQWDTTPDYFNGRYGSKEWFGDRIAKRSDLGAGYFSDEIMRWVQSDEFAAWQAAQPVPPDYGPPDFGDYTVIQGGVYVFDFALIRDDHGRFYLNYGNSYGIPGVSIVRGKILVKTAEGYQDIDQLDVTWDQKSTIMSEALTGEARSIAGGYPYITFGYSAGINPPYYRFVEGGIFISPSPVSLSFSPLNTTFLLSGR